MKKIKNMKKTGRISMIRKIASIIFAVGCSVGSHAFAQTNASWGDLNAEGARESLSTDLAHPGRYAFDADTSSSWALAAGSSSGWIERYWSAPQKLLGANIQVDLPAGVSLTICYDAAGTWVPVPGASLFGVKNYSSTIWFPSSLPATTKVLFVLEGKDADQARVWNVDFIDNPCVKPFGKIHPKSYTFNQPEYINLKPDRLWDSCIQNAWFEPLWSFPWEIFQTTGANIPTKIFPPYKGNPPNQGELICELDGSYDISLLKAYCKETWRSIAFEFWDGTQWTQKQTIYGNTAKGWQRIALSKPITARRVRITFPNGWESARFISEVELWGEGAAESLPRPLVMPPVASDGSYYFTVAGLQQKDYRIDIAVKGKQTLPVTGAFNGVNFSASPTTTQGEETMYRVVLQGDQIDGDTQFFRFNSAAKPIGATVTEQKDDGRIALDRAVCDDYVNVPDSASANKIREKSWALGKTYGLERIKIFCDNVPDLTFKVINHQKLTTVPLSFNKAESCWTGDLAGIEADAISLSSNAAFATYEVYLYGSPLSDDKAPFEVWWPEKNSTVTSASQDGNSLIGWLGDSTMSASVGKFSPRQADKVFWMPLGQMGFAPGEEKTFSVTAQSGSASSTKNVKIAWSSGQTVATLDQGASLSATTASSIALSGTVFTKDARCFVNDSEIALSGKAFSTVCSLRFGYQALNIEIWDKSKKRLLASFQKPVYRTVGMPIVTFDQPYGDLCTQRDALTISGRVGNGVGLSLFINNVSTKIVNDSFSVTLPLIEGANTFNFSLRDSAGRVTSKTLAAYRDRTNPVVTILSPTEGQYIQTSVATFTLNGGDAEQALWWQINDEDWELGPQGTMTKGISLSDGFYAYTVRAQDRSGNVSEKKSVNFCVDATPPKEFAIQSNVTGWTSNVTPTISFSTVDATSGLERYEYAVDTLDWKPVASPFTLPALKDGKHTVFVRAIDRAGNTRISYLPLNIDTSAPTTPTSVRVVPGKNFLTVKWTGIDDGEGYQTYRVERKPAFASGIVAVSSKAYGSQEYYDGSLNPADKYSYRVWAVDRAGNECAKSEWMSGIVGFQSVEVKPDSDTFAEYNDFTMRVPKGAMADDVVNIQVNEISLDSTVESPRQPVVGSLYEVSVLRKNTTGTEITLHADLKIPATLEIAYDSAKIPSGYTDADLKPFYYDDVLGQWVPFDDAFVDPDKKVIRLTTNHFTEMAILATKEVDLSPQQIHGEEMSPSRTAVGPSDVSVSPSGYVSASFTELVLPGKNGLDLTLGRTYSTATALKDAPEANEEGSIQTDDIDGESAWKIAAGWRLNLPSMRRNGSNLWITDLDGKKTSFNQMSDYKAQKTDTTDMDHPVVTLYKQNHEGGDTYYEIKLIGKKHVRFFPINEHTRYYTYKIGSVTVTMRDGRKATFNLRGQVTKIEDATGLNSIKFSYSDNKIDTIVDTFDRTIRFAHDPINNFISSITVSSGITVSNTIQYTLDGDKLASATDIGGRVWKYGYTDKKIYWESLLTNPPEGCTDVSTEKSYTLRAISEISGPGIGKTILFYDTTTMVYPDSVDEVSAANQKKSYSYEVTTSHLLAKRKELYLGNNSQDGFLRATDYSFKEVFKGNKQFYTQQSTVNDGRVETTTDYTAFEKTRESLSIAPEALRKILGYSVGTRIENNTEYPFRPTAITRKIDGATISTETRVWDDSTLRICTTTTVKSAEKIYRTRAISYDAWGNIINDSEVSCVGDRKQERIISKLFYFGNDTVSEKDKQAYRIPDDLKSPALKESAIRFDLPMSRKVIVISQVPDANEKSSVEELELYAYNDLGQLTQKKRCVDNDKWALSSYTYKVDGQLATVIDPFGGVGATQETDYDYDYSNSDVYVVTETKLNVTLSSKTQTIQNIVRKNAYKKLDGTPFWSQDALGFVTSFAYDALGRMTSEIKPSNSDISRDTSKTESYMQPVARGNDNPRISIAYNDTNLLTTVTDELGSISEYQFDAAGRLSSVKKASKTKSSIDKNDGDVITTEYLYDGYDEPLKITGPYSEREMTKTKEIKEQLVTAFRYDKQGRVLYKILPGNTGFQAFAYDDENNTITETDERGGKYRRTVDWNGNAIASEVSLNKEWKGSVYYFDGANRLVKKIDPMKKVTQIAYNEQGLESTIVRPSRTVFENGADKTVTPITNITYYPDGILQSISESCNDKTTEIRNSEVNGLGWVLETTAPVKDGTVSKNVVALTEYDPRGLVLAKKSGYEGDPLFGKSWSYDATGNALTETDGRGYVTSFTHDAAGNRTSVTDPRNVNTAYAGEFTMTMSYDQFGRLIDAKLPKMSAAESADRHVLFEYDGRGNVTKRSDADGSVKTYEFSARNWLLSETVEGDNSQAKLTTTHGYDNAGNETNTTLFTGRTIDRIYDEAGRVTRAGSDAEGWTQYAYNDDGTVSSVTDPRGMVSTYAYNPEGQVMSVIDALKETFKTEYDSLGRVVRTEDPEKNVHIYSYDEIGRLIAETTPMSKERTYSYDGRGNIVNFIDERHTTFVRVYDADNHLTQETATNGTVTETLSCAYDEAGDAKDANNGIDTLINYVNGVYQPNAYGAITGTSDSVDETNVSMGYSYDSAMRLTGITGPNKETTAYSYNKLGELTNVTGWLNEVGITYNKGRISKFTTANGTTKAITYDTADRIVSIAYNGNGVALKKYEFEYDASSNIVKKNQNAYTYDQLNRLKTTYEYGWFQKNPSDIAPAYGEAARDYDGKASVNYAITPVDSHKQIVVLDAASKGIACDLLSPLWVNKLELMPDAISHRVRAKDIAIYYFSTNESGTAEWKKAENIDIEKDEATGVFTVYFHTAIETRYLKVTSIWDDRDIDNASVISYSTFKNYARDLLRVWTLSRSHTEAYVYDAIGNRVELNADGSSTENEFYKNTNSGNTARIKKDGAWYYIYDDAGNRTRKGRAVTGSGDAITIDSSGENWTYTWDLHDRLIKVESSTGVSVQYKYNALNQRVKRIGKDGTTIYAYGRNGALTYQKNTTSGLERSYTYMNDILLGWTETTNGASTRYYAVTDNLGSVTQIRDANNKLLWDGEYAPFGTMTGAVGEKRFDGMFTGKDIDPETGLTYHWNRWRSEDGSYFISEDPARDGINWYAYASENPLRFSDPTGLTVDSDVAESIAGTYNQNHPTPTGPGENDNSVPGNDITNGQGDNSSIAQIDVEGYPFINGEKTSITVHKATKEQGKKGPATENKGSDPGDKGKEKGTGTEGSGKTNNTLPGQMPPGTPETGPGWNRKVVFPVFSGPQPDLPLGTGLEFDILAGADLLKLGFTFARWGFKVGLPALVDVVAKKAPAVNAIPKIDLQWFADEIKTLQTGGNTLTKKTLEALGLSKEEGKAAIEGLKGDLLKRNDYHQIIKSNGDYVDGNTGETLGNLFNFLP